MKATKEQIIAEANRRRAEHGEGAPPVEHFIVDVVCENWTPPEPVDPDILAFREWAKRSILKHISGRDVDAGKFDDVLDAHAYLAGARMAREQERERAKVLVSRLSDLILRVEEDWALGDVTGINASEMISAREALAKYRGEA